MGSPRISSTCSPFRRASFRRTPSSLEFKAIQTYSDGTSVSWIEDTVKGAPAPEHPAPILKLTGKAKKQ